jgi:hypothetical protein
MNLQIPTFYGFPGESQENSHYAKKYSKSSVKPVFHVLNILCGGTET